MGITRRIPSGTGVTRRLPAPSGGGVTPPAVTVAPADLAVLWNAVEDPDPTTAVTDIRLTLPRADVAEDGNATTNLDKTFVLI